MKYFGTDGIRARVNNSFLKQNFALSLGEAVGMFVKKNNPTNSTILIGRDTRSSGDMLLQAFAQGLSNLNCQAISIGIVPTPGSCSKRDKQQKCTRCNDNRLP